MYIEYYYFVVVKLLNCVQLFCDPHGLYPAMGFPRQEY